MRNWITVGIGVGLAAGCTGASDPLDTEGPPEILQVLVRERVESTDDEGNPVVVLENHLAYGDHDDIDPEADDREVTAAAARGGQRIRIVVDELLRANHLEEIPCADGSWSQVPDGFDFDDVARCAGSDLSRCEGLCIGSDGPVGIQDDNGDGAIDDTRMIDGVVALTCGDEAVALDPTLSYYQPSGSQRLSAGATGTDSLGPAIVIVPAAGMRPGSTCGIAFGDMVVDKQDNLIAGAEDVAFSVEPFLVLGSDPATGATEVPLTAPDQPDATIAIHLNASLDPQTVPTAVTVTADGVAVKGLTIAPSPDDDATIVVTVPGGLTAATTYEVTVTGGAGGLADTYADTLAGDVTITFATAP
jgi:hypothetical protein